MPVTRHGDTEGLFIPIKDDRSRIIMSMRASDRRFVDVVSREEADAALRDLGINHDGA